MSEIDSVVGEFLASRNKSELSQFQLVWLSLDNAGLLCEAFFLALPQAR
jgi:hypothetical protein